MFPNRTIPFLILIATHYAVPLALIAWLWAGRPKSRFAWSVKALFAAAYIVLLYFIGFWGFASFYVRYLWVLLLAVAGVRSLAKSPRLPFFARMRPANWVFTAAASAMSVFFILGIIGAVEARHYDARPAELSFPFKGGVYSPYWGGNGKASSFMNYHYLSSKHQGAGTNLSMKYAVDIEKLNILGMSSKGFFPYELEGYEIYHQDILAPCDGKVVEVVDGLRNEMPWIGKYPYNVGNHVAIRTGEFCVILGHMQKGSIPVKEGDSVKTGDVIGKVGSSGMADQPHVHIQAMKAGSGSIWSWEGVPILFDGKNPVKNSLFFK